jgi:hypothetical protein
MYPGEITLRYLRGQEMQNCGGSSGGFLLKKRKRGVFCGGNSVFDIDLGIADNGLD